MHFQHRCCSLIESICVQQNERRRGRGKERGEGSRCTRAAIVRLVTREACTRYFWEVNGPDYEVQVLRSVTVPVIHSIPPPTVSRRRDFRFVQKPSSLFKTYLSILLFQNFLRYYSLYLTLCILYILFLVSLSLLHLKFHRNLVKKIFAFFFKLFDHSIDLLFPFKSIVI